MALGLSPWAITGAEKGAFPFPSFSLAPAKGVHRLGGHPGTMGLKERGELERPQLPWHCSAGSTGGC